MPHRLHRLHRPPTSRPAPPPAQPAVVTATTQPTDAPDPRVRAKRLFYDAVAGDKGAVEESRRAWGEIRRADAEDVTTTGYLGAATMLAAAQAPWPWDKGNLAKEGMSLLDAAVAAAPADLEVRFLRGMTNYRLPRFFGRAGLASKDLAFVAARARQAAEAGELPRPLAAAALYHYGVLRAEQRDRAAASAAWREATEIGPESPAGLAAAERLEGKAAR